MKKLLLLTVLFAGACSTQDTDKDFLSAVKGKSLYDGTTLEGSFSSDGETLTLKFESSSYKLYDTILFTGTYTNSKSEYLGVILTDDSTKVELMTSDNETKTYDMK